MTQPDPGLPRYPAAMVNITNRCNLRCRHCFVYREGNPNRPAEEMETATMVKKLAELQQRHGIMAMLWMGGEPLLRPDVLREGVKIFQQNNITTNGTQVPAANPVMMRPISRPLASCAVPIT